MILKKNGIEIEYNEGLLEKIREALGKEPDDHVSDDDIVLFFHNSFDSALSKGYAQEE